MRNIITLTVTSFKMALQELRVNKLRTFLSLLGVTIGIFCMVAVFTMLDSMEKNIRKNVASLGNDVVYIGKWPWVPEGNEYRWWDYLNRPVMNFNDLTVVQQQSQTVHYASLCYSKNDISAKHDQNEISGITLYAITQHFEKMQNFDIKLGRYFSPIELIGGNHNAIIGEEVYEQLFPDNTNPLGKLIAFQGQRFNITGVLKKTGSNMAGFNFDNCIMIPYNTAKSFLNVADKQTSNVSLIIKATSGISVNDMISEVTGILRSAHRLAPGTKDDFSMNRLSQVTDRLNVMFATIDFIGLIISFFSLLVGGFGIANIMFVSVKERTKIIGLKKAIGAKGSAILSEFLIESVILCIMGGLIGIFIVFILGLILTGPAGFPVTMSFKNILLGLGISTLVGVLSGYIPARSAARMNPVTAIRST